MFEEPWTLSWQKRKKKESLNSFSIGLCIGDCGEIYRANEVFVMSDIGLICLLLYLLALVILLLVFLTMEVNCQDKVFIFWI